MTINRVQGYSLRVEDCDQGGQHVLTRARQKYCDRCRPKKSTAALDRQRRHRERIKTAPTLLSSPGAPQPDQPTSDRPVEHVEPLVALERSLAGHVEVLERLIEHTMVMIERRAATRVPSRALIARHADLTALQQLLMDGVARAAQMNKRPALRDASRPRPS